MRVIAFAFFPDGSVPESAYRGTQTFDRLVPNPEGFRQSVFQDFSFGIESLLDRWRDDNIFRSLKEPIGVSAKRSKRATGFALRLPIRRANLGLPLE